MTQFHGNSSRRPSQNKKPNPPLDSELKIDIALHENRFAEAVELFEQQADCYQYQSHIAGSLARKVCAIHSELAMIIWLNTAEAEISKVNPNNCPIAGEYLREIRLICQQQNTLPRWERILSDVRQRYKAKKRL